MIVLGAYAYNCCLYYGDFTDVLIELIIIGDKFLEGLFWITLYLWYAGIATLYVRLISKFHVV